MRLACLRIGLCVTVQRSDHAIPRQVGGIPEPLHAPVPSRVHAPALSRVHAPALSRVHSPMHALTPHDLPSAGHAISRRCSVGAPGESPRSSSPDRIGVRALERDASSAVGVHTDSVSSRPEPSSPPRVVMVRTVDTRPSRPAGCYAHRPSIERCRPPVSLTRRGNGHASARRKRRSMARGSQPRGPAIASVIQRPIAEEPPCPPRLPPTARRWRASRP